jgi:anaerobic selenocysteine-containing dehydrogenase
LELERHAFDRIGCSGGVERRAGRVRDLRDDARERGIGEGDRIRLTSATGSLAGTAKLVRLPRSTLQVHWPEGNVLIAAGPDHREPGSRVPDYNAVVTLERMDPTA